MESMIPTLKPTRFFLVPFLALMTVLVSATAQEQPAKALLSFVENECQGNWDRIASRPPVLDFSKSVLEGYAGTFSANPIVEGIDPKYQAYFGRWFHAERVVGGTRYPVDVFTRIQRNDAKLDYQNFLRVFGDGEKELTWQNHFYFPTRVQHPVWTGQTYDAPKPEDQQGELHAHWKCSVNYPADGRLRFSAMHEIYLSGKDGSAPIRVQIEVRQSANQGTTSQTSKEIFTCPTYGTGWYVNGFGHPAYKVWTLTLEKNYDPASVFDGNVNITGMINYLKANPEVWPGGVFPADHVIRRVETGVEVWQGGEGSGFTSHSCSLWWK
jgi:hypothetical protein